MKQSICILMLGIALMAGPAHIQAGIWSNSLAGTKNFAKGLLVTGNTKSDSKAEVVGAYTRYTGMVLGVAGAAYLMHRNSVYKHAENFADNFATGVCTGNTNSSSMGEKIGAYTVEGLALGARGLCALLKAYNDYNEGYYYTGNTQSNSFWEQIGARSRNARLIAVADRMPV